ncbi:L-dopachrome tautomerase-related protein [Aquimarina sp. 2304DJ70-9]|uniref:L-dopachrome tautomerase-related protein n=1 Tax=Aquimarina penaris TaxID=3231044 RepID=UPI003462C050
MKRKKILISLIVTIVGLVLLLALFFRLRYGGGQEYQNISTQAHYNSSQLEQVIAFEEPIGNVAASKDTTQTTRVFFTIHPESRPETNKLMEIIDGKAVPYPNEAFQEKFNTILGVFTDQQHRLWVIDHGNHGFDPVKVVAFDLATNQIVHDYTFPNDIAKKLSFFNDLSVSADGKYLAVANVSFFGKKPSIAMYNLETGESKNQLENHPSVQHEGYVPVTPAKKMRFFGGVIDLLTGIDGIDFSRDGKYIYYAPMGHSGLFRVSTEIITDFTRSDEEISTAVERVADKPLSDGIRTDFNGNVYITDIEHQGVYVVTPERKGFTLIKDERIRWADGLSMTNDGTFYLADSDIPNQMLQSKKHIAKHAPYYIYRFKGLDSNK